MTERYDTTKHWYAIHTYSGYEEKVAESIRQRAESLDMKDKIFQIVVPKEKMIEIKNGKRKVVEKRIFQGYVLVHMKMSEDAWYIVRNTPSVTGFVGSGTEPTPVSDDEMEKIMKRMGRAEPKHKIDFNEGEVVMTSLIFPKAGRNDLRFRILGANDATRVTSIDSHDLRSAWR